MKKTTRLKKMCKISLLFFMMFCMKTVTAQTVLFSEDFSSITTGDNTTLTGSETPWTRNSNLATAWRTFQAGGALRLGNGNASANLGYIVTNRLDLSANGGIFTVSFDVKGWTTVENQIKVLITGVEHQFVTYSATIDQDFERVTLYYTGGVANSSITIETTEKRAFIDNILVTTTPEGQILASPVTTPPTDITGNSFTANWGRVSGATGYILDVSMSLEFDSYVEGYENVVLGDSWSYPVTGLLPNTQYYYRLRATNDAVTSITSNVMGVVTAVLGTNSFNKMGLRHYPNPVSNTLSLTAVQELSFVEVYTLTGQQVIKKAVNANTAAIDVSALTAGYYFVKVMAGSESTTLKVIKK